MKLEVLREGSAIPLYTRVEEVGLQEFAVSSLFAGAEVHVLHAGDELKCIFTDKATHAQYGFASQVLRREARVVPLYYLSRPQFFTRIQRRAFVRLPVLIPQLFRTSDDSPWHQGYLLDISAGGVRISHRDPLVVDQELMLQFALRKGEGPFVVRGYIVRVERVEAAGPATFHSGIRFKALTEAMEDLIVGYVFERLLARRRKQDM